jgi:pyruvate/2-oxoglutarate dehydrogenase complex dihydrolipoamide dehydrogenase (E3) component
MGIILRTEATDETQGFMKVVISANDDRIPGFTMIGSEAGEVVAAIQTAMLAELPYTKLRDAVIRTSRSPKVSALFSATCRHELRDRI